MELDGLLDERITDRFIADAIGYSERFVQKGLHALQHKLAELGQAIIDRMPNQGRRIISFVRGLAPRRNAQPRPTPNPPQTPPEEFQIKIERQQTGHRRRRPRSSSRRRIRTIPRSPLWWRVPVA